MPKFSRSPSILGDHELAARILRYFMRRAQILFQNPEFAQDPSRILMVREIFQEEYNNRPRFASRSRQIRICPFTGRKRGYYN